MPQKAVRAAKHCDKRREACKEIVHINCFNFNMIRRAKKLKCKMFGKSYKA